MACTAPALDWRASPTRSLPDAYWAAPKLKETARAPNIPEKSFDMACPPSILCRCKREQVHNAGCYVGFGTRSSLNRVHKSFGHCGTSAGAERSHGSRLSPLPQLTGDVGRSCGDASCALLFAQI